MQASRCYTQGDSVYPLTIFRSSLERNASLRKLNISIWKTKLLVYVCLVTFDEDDLYACRVWKRSHQGKNQALK